MNKVTHVTRLLVLSAVTLLAACTAPQQQVQPAKKIDISPAQQLAYNTAIENIKNDKKDQAYTALKELIKLNPGISNAHLNLGILQAEKQELDAAESSFNKAIEADAGNYIVYNQLGILLRKKGKFAEAENNYKKAIELNPDYANAHINLGILYDLYMYKLDNALEHYKKYQSLIKTEDSKIEKWIVELERRNKK